MTKIVINTGPSERGWHRIEAMLRCPSLYAFKYRHAELGGEHDDEEDKDALVRGSLGHVGLAHFYARLGSIQSGKDQDLYYEPHDAIELVGKEMGGIALNYIEPMQKCIAAYAAHYAGERMKVRAVERVVEMQFNGHRMTQRFDLVVEDPHGRVYVWDHKIVSRIDRRSTTRYNLSGQFLEMVHQGRNAYGDAFAGVRVNLLQADGNKFSRVTPDPAPLALQQFPANVAHAEELIAKYAHLQPHEYPKVLSEQSCMTPYGPCPATEFCKWGPSRP